MTETKAEVVKFASCRREWTTSGATETITYYGTRDEMLAKQSANPIGSREGTLAVSFSNVFQEGGELWACEIRFSGGSDGLFVEPPSVEFGKKSAQLSGGMLSLPLSALSNYRMRWDHYIYCAPGKTAEAQKIWTAATTPLIEGSAADYCTWSKDYVPYMMVKNVRWRCASVLEMPGVNSVDVATYAVTETARFRSAKSAGKMVAGSLNRIGAPDETFGIKDGNWKCDSASIRYNGKCWLATLTWTRSGDSRGWNAKLYETIADKSTTGLSK